MKVSLRNGLLGLPLMLAASLPMIASAQSDVNERYLQALEARISETRAEVEKLADILDRATEHHGFVTGDFWNVPAGLYTAESYWQLTNQYPFGHFWENAVTSPVDDRLFSPHKTNYRRVINGVELQPGFSPQSRPNLRAAYGNVEAMGHSHGSVLLRAGLQDQVLRHMQNGLNQVTRSAGARNQSAADRQQFMQALEQESGLQDLLDLLVNELYLNNLNTLYAGRVAYGNMQRAEQKNTGIIRCLEQDDDAFVPALHRERLENCDSDYQIDDYYAAAQLDNQRSKTPTPYEFFRDNEFMIRFDLEPQQFVVSGYADERQRFSQLYDLEQTLNSLVEQGKAREETHGDFRFFFSTQAADGYPAAIAVDFESGNGLWLTPLYMARKDIAEQVERINKAVDETFELSRETFDTMMTEFIASYQGQDTNGAAQTNGF